MVTRRLLVIVGAHLLLAAAQPVHAMDSTGKYTILGPGNLSCGEWLSIRRQGNDYAISSWVTGYVTAYNTFPNGKINIAGGTDVEGMLAWIDNYCAKNPLDKIAAAAVALSDELMGRALGTTTSR